MGQLRHMGHWDIHFGMPKMQFTRSVISGWDSCDTWDRGPQPVIRFTADHAVARDMLTIEHLLSVYQGDANVASGAG
jgi:hypothetical protein